MFIDDFIVVRSGKEKNENSCDYVVRQINFIALKKRRMTRSLFVKGQRRSGEGYFDKKTIKRSPTRKKQEEEEMKTQKKKTYTFYTFALYNQHHFASAPTLFFLQTYIVLWQTAHCIFIKSILCAQSITYISRMLTINQLGFTFSLSLPRSYSLIDIILFLHTYKSYETIAE